MTIDSAYFPESYTLGPEDEFYTFSFESIGIDTITVTLDSVDENNDPIIVTPIPESYSLFLGGIPPIYQRGDLEIIDMGTYTDATAINFNRDTPITQELALVSGEPFPAESFEFSLDKLTLICQELEGEKCDCPYGGTEDDPNPASPPPSELPECNPYTCDAYETYLNDSGITWSKAWSVSAITPLEYPFATNVAALNKFFYYGNYISAPGLITDWTGGPPNASASISNAPLAGYDPPDFCGGVLEQAMCIDSDQPAGPGVLMRQSFSGPASEWGDHAAEAMVMGTNGTNGMSGSFLRKSGKYWRWTRNGITANYDDPATIAVDVSNSGADLTVTLRVNNQVGLGYPTTNTESFTIIGGAGKVNKLSASISSTMPREEVKPGAPTLFQVVRDVTVKASCGGQSATLTATQAYVSSTSGSKPITNLQERTHTFYTQALAFYVARMSVLSFQWGKFTVDTTQESDIAYDRNFVEYTPPEYC